MAATTSTRSCRHTRLRRQTGPCKSPARCGAVRSLARRPRALAADRGSQKSTPTARAGDFKIPRRDFAYSAGRKKKKRVGLNEKLVRSLPALRGSAPPSPLPAQGRAASVFLEIAAAILDRAIRRSQLAGPEARRRPADAPRRPAHSAPGPGAWAMHSSPYGFHCHSARVGVLLRTHVGRALGRARIGRANAAHPSEGRRRSANIPSISLS